MNWGKVGDTISGTYDGINQFYVPGYGYQYEGEVITKTCATCGHAEKDSFRLPADLNEKLRAVKRGTPITITYVERRGPSKIFEVRS